MFSLLAGKIASNLSGQNSANLGLTRIRKIRPYNVNGFKISTEGRLNLSQYDVETESRKHLAHLHDEYSSHCQPL